MGAGISIRLVGKLVKVLPLRDEDGKRIDDPNGLTGRLGTVLDAGPENALVRMEDRQIMVFNLDRISIIRR